MVIDSAQFGTLSTTKTWFDTWLKAFGDDECGIWGKKVNDQEVQIPFCKKCFPLGPIKIQTAQGATNDHTPRYDIRGVLADPAQSLNDMMQQLAVNMLSFSFVSSSSRLLDAIENNQSSILQHIDFCEVSPYVDCTIEWDKYWQSRGKTKSTWQRREKKLMNKLGARFECVTDWKTAEPLLPIIFEIEASGWKGQQGSAIKQNKSVLDFYTNITKTWADEGLLRLFILYLEDKPIAFQLNAYYNHVLYHMKIGFSEEYSNLSPGQALQMQILRWAFDQPDVHKFDLLGGGGEAAPVKMKWATHAERLNTVYVFRRNLPGLLLWLRIVLAPVLKSRLLGKKSKRPPILPHPLTD
jgi:hypothetical protein